jgi:drug/metabolite transporter (DMT)-like permease
LATKPFNRLYPFRPAVFDALSGEPIIQEESGYVNSGLVYALLALVSYSVLGVLHKLADVKGTRPAAINVLLYLSSLVILLMAGLLIGNPALTGPVSPKLLALPFGVSSAVAILALQTALRFGNISTSWLAINLSSGLPTVASIVLYHEPINSRKSISLILITAAMILLWKDKDIEVRKTTVPAAIQENR